MAMQSQKIKLKKGDMVRIVTGRDKGKTGKVAAVHPKENSVTIEDINVVTRHRKPTRTEPQGGVRKENRPINVSKVGLVQPQKKNRTSRIGYRLDKSGKKQRVYRQAGNKEVK